jgi:hypothetical protein
MFVQQETCRVSQIWPQCRICSSRSYPSRYLGCFWSQVLPKRTLLSMLGFEFEQSLILLSDGARGGFLFAWRRHINVSRATRVNSYNVTTQLKQNNGQFWWLTCVYGPQRFVYKISFLQELRTIRENCPGPWAIIGDFNLILNDEDKSNNNLNRSLMGRFRKVVNDLSLINLPCMEENLHGPICKTLPLLLSLTEFYAPLIGKGLTQMLLL